MIRHLRPCLHAFTAFVVSLALCCFVACGSQSQKGDVNADPLENAISGLAQFSFDWPQPIFRSIRAESEVGSDRWNRATFGLATCLHQASPTKEAAIAEADVLFAELAKAVPDSPFAAQALLNRGRIAELIDFFQDPVDLPAAREFYETVRAQWPTEAIAGEATLRLAGTYVQTNEVEEVVKGVSTLRSWLGDHPQDPMAAAMWQYLGDTLFLQQKDYPAALDAYLHADAIGLMWPARESIVWWRIASIAEKHLKDRETAITFYTKICTDAQTSGRAFEAQIALHRLGAVVPELTAFKAYPGAPPSFDEPQAPKAPPVESQKGAP